MKNYYRDLSFIQNNNNKLIVNTDIMTITGFMDKREKIDHILRYCEYILESSECERTMEICEYYNNKRRPFTMKQISKTEFKKLHEAGELQLITSAPKTKEEVMAAIEKVRLNIDQYLKPVTSFGNITTDNDGIQVTNIYRSDCEDFIFVETINDGSKDKNCSWDTIQISTVAYLTC